MKNIEELKKAMDSAITIAIATSVNDNPNVRIVNYVWDENKPGTIYFTSFISNDKVKEFKSNNKVSITTIPTDLESSVHLRSKNATAKESKKNTSEVKDMFLKKSPAYGEALEYMGDDLKVFEIELKEATVIIDFDNTVKIEF